MKSIYRFRFAWLVPAVLSANLSVALAMSAGDSGLQSIMARCQVVHEVERWDDNDPDWYIYKKGDRSQNVKAIQYLLRARGYKVVVDGHYGDQTENAVKAFQRKIKLAPTGIVKGSTWRPLVITVKKGSKGDAVRAAQTVLKKYEEQLGKVVVDGVFGSQTERQVKEYQGWVERKKTGIMDRQAWGELLMGGFGSGGRDSR